MLILAGVAISAVIDGDGLFKKSREATKSYEKASKDENKTISNLMNYIDRYMSETTTSSNNKEEIIAPAVAEIASSNVSATAFTLTANGKADAGIEKYEFYVDGNLEKTVTSNKESVTYNVTGKTLGTTYTYKVKVYDKVGKYKESEEIKVISTEIFAANETATETTSGTYNNPIIPKGFAPISENGANWGTATGYQSGLVITDAINPNTGASTGNEFVWVPVDGTNVKFERIESSGKDTLTKSQCTDSLPTELSQSVSDNQGFYIARFEAGTGNVSKQGVSVYNNVNWAMAKSQAEAKYTSTNPDYGIVSTLAYGTQWDTALSFIMAYGGSTDYPNFLTNSTGYGNYSSGDNIFGTPDICGSTASDSNLETDEFRQKNIYDMAGNVTEWTMEAYDSYCIYRGGDCNQSGSARPSTERHRGNASGTSYALGFRIALYIKTPTES